MEYYLKYFGLTANYSINELKNAYRKKIISISKLNIPDIDKYLYIEQTRLLYRQAKNDYKFKNTNIFDNFAKIFDNTYKVNNNNYSSYSNFSSYSEKLNKDGTKTIFETVKTNKNGIENKKTHAYKKYPDGTIEKINDKLLK